MTPLAGWLAAATSVLAAVAAAAPAGAQYRHFGGSSYYLLDMREASPGSALEEVTGRQVRDTMMVSCTVQRNELQLSLEFTDADGTVSERQGSSVHTETRDEQGHRLTLDTSTYADGRLVERLVLTAEETGEGLDVITTDPAGGRYALAGDIRFSSSLVRETITAIGLGLGSFEYLEYDGVGGPGEVLRLEGTIGAPSTDPVTGLDPALAERVGIAGLRHWPVEYRYFEDDASEPIYQFHSVVFENGFALDTIYIFRDYSLDLTLVDFDPPRIDGCPGGEG